MLTTAYDTPPAWETDMEVAAPLLRLLRQDAITVDAASRTGAPVFVCSAPPRNTTLWFRDPPMRVWWGSFMFRTGMNSAQFVLDFLPRGGTTQTVQVLFNGTVVWSQALTLNVSQTLTPSVSLTGRGWSDRQVVEVEVRIVWTGSVAGVDTNTTRYIVRMARVGPVSGYLSGRPWSSVLYFGLLSAANLNALSTAVQWLMDRVNLVYTPLFMGSRYANTRAGKAQSFSQYWMSTYVQNVTWLKGDLYAFVNNPAEQFRITANGATVASSSTYSPSAFQQHWEISANLSGYSGRVDLTLDGTIAQGGVSTRYSFPELWMDPGSSALGSALPNFVDLEDLDFGTLQGRLNALVDVLNQTYTRIYNAPDVFDWIPMFSRRPVPRSGVDDTSGSPDKAMESADTGWKDFYMAGKTRRGNVLWVYGRDVTVCWGPIAIKDTSKRPQWEMEWAFTQQLIDGQSVALKKIYLPGLPGLDFGARYFLRGDVRFAAEELR